MVTSSGFPFIKSRARNDADKNPARCARALVTVPAVVVIVGTAAYAWSRVGLLDLPGVPSDLTASTAGLSNLNDMKSVDGFLTHGLGTPDDVTANATISSQMTPRHYGYMAMARLRLGRDVAADLDMLGKAVKSAPDDLTLSNAFRMEVFKLRRDYLNEARKRGEVMPQFPEYLDKQPIKFFEELVKEHPSRETKLSLALSWVDNMLLFPALEIKAPSSVEAVNILTELLNEPGNEDYVPALFARGLNHLHRPSRLVWPESNKTPRDAAVRDIAQCVAIGRKLGVGSKHLQAVLAMTLGDAYLKANKFNQARSWWQIAQNLCHDDDIQQGVLRRYSWRDEEMVDRLEEELDSSRSELEHPMTDLALMWN